jgi:hypothetical protein
MLDCYRLTIQTARSQLPRHPDFVAFVYFVVQRGLADRLAGTDR